MKKFLCLLFTVLFCISCISCSNNKTVKTSQPAKSLSFSPAEALPSIKMEQDKYNEFCSFLAFDNISCPFSNLFGIEKALNEKNNRSFDVSIHSYDFLSGASNIDAEKLYTTVKENNTKYMEGSDKFFYELLDDSSLKEYCTVVADTLNNILKSDESVDLNSLSCTLANLKILNSSSMNYGVYNPEKNILAITDDMVQNKKKSTNNADFIKITIAHESVHVLQSHCCDVALNENDFFIGTSFSFGNLDINPLKNRWIYESSAEYATSALYNIKPSTYRQMINKLISLSIATISDNNIHLPQDLYHTNDAGSLYQAIGFSNPEKSAEFLYAIELLCEKSEDFKKVYESQNSAVSDYSAFLRDNFDPYYLEVVSKLFYKNMALKLTQTEISLNDVFYLVSLFEKNMKSYIPFDSSPFITQYNEVKNAFFSSLISNENADINQLYSDYKMYHGENNMYINASFEWLDENKKSFILHTSAII